MKIRSFIAINLPRDIRDYLADIITDLKKQNPDMNIKWVNPENLHFTLHFLGSLAEQALERVKEVIGQSIGESSSVKVELENFGGFPNLNWPRILFISCQEIGDNILKNIQEKIGRQLEKIGIEVDKRPWQMHITLARLRKPLLITNLDKLRIEKLKFKVTSIDLMKSELSRTGANYSIIEKFPLKPSI